MELVIKISEKDWKFMQDTYKETGLDFVPEAIKRECVKAVYNGTPLPEGHGRLIDADALDDNCDWCHTDDDGSWCYKCKDIDNAPTIIP